MDKTLTIIFFEDYFVCSILPNESAWEALQVNGSDQMLLYFYVSGGDVRNDVFAKERFEENENDKNAFGDFYEIILEKDKTFRRFDLELESINLLKDVIEEVKAVYAERIVSFIPELNINDEIPLNICFIPGISREVQDRIISYFLKEGFVLNYKADYFESFAKILQRKGIIASKINFSIVESYFGDLLFHYIEYNDKILKKESETLVGKGVDHRIANLAKLIVEKAAHKSSSRILNDKILLEQEIKKFHRRAATEINNFYYNDLDVKIELSDYNTTRVIIDQRDLEKMSAESFLFIKFKYESFISKHSNLARTEKILLNGKVLASDAFTQFFQKTFGASKVVKPFDNFVELLSRGIFTNAPSLNFEAITSTEEIEIKITLTKKPPIPEYKLPERIPIPENKKPPLPPSKSVNNSIANINTSDYSKLLNKIGIAVTDLGKSGKIEVDSEIYTATAETLNILKGKKVKIIDYDKDGVVVKEFLLPAPPPPLPKKKT